MLKRIKGIIISPAREWIIIAREKNDVKTLLIAWVLPLLGITLVCTIIGNILARRGAFTIGIAQGIVQVLFALVTLFVAACVANFLAPKFGGKSDFSRSFALVAYSMTPVWLAGVFYLFPSLGGLLYFIASLYGLYILYFGIYPMKSVPNTKTLLYFIALIIVWIIVSIALSIFLLSPLTILILDVIDAESAVALRAASVLESINF